VLITTVGGGWVAFTVKVVEVETVMPALMAVTTSVCEPAEALANVPVLTAVAVPRPDVDPITIALPSSDALTLSTKKPLLEVVVNV